MEFIIDIVCIIFFIGIIIFSIRNAICDKFLRKNAIITIIFSLITILNIMVLINKKKITLEQANQIENEYSNAFLYFPFEGITVNGDTIKFNVSFSFYEKVSNEFSNDVKISTISYLDSFILKEERYYNDLSNDINDILKGSAGYYFEINKENSKKLFTQ